MQCSLWLRSFPQFFVGLVFTILASLGHAAEPHKGFSGDWVGTLNASPAVKLPLVIHLEQTADGWQGSLDSPAQGAMGIPMSAVTVDGQRLQFEIAVIKARYQGTLDPASGAVRGTFTQGQSFELDFTRQTKQAAQANLPVRPQTPVAPFPYSEEEVQVVNAAADITLAGTLTRPAGAIKATAVLITGSGPQNRDEFIAGHKPFAVLADHLSRNGFAVLRLDDRGVGKSTGEFNTATSEDFVGDISAAVDYLQGREDIPSHTIGLLGHSEGGMIAPMVARQRDDLAFIIMLAAPGVDIVEMYIEQRGKILGASGVSPASLQKIREIDHVVFAQINQLPEGQALPAATLDKLREIARVAGMTDPDGIEQQVAALAEFYSSPWFRYFLKFDPAPYLSELRTPVLALNGSLDMQVVAQQNLTGIRNSLRASAHQDFEVVELKGLNHLFQTAQTGAITEYAVIEETMAPKALNYMSAWLDDRFAEQAR
uniref:alpha/beta hydrolase family protein n=1 Tax=Microbulbifer agarilyticus TaxID=260552 RepID=UPI0002558AA3|nr:alpha/beta fold hydrolase [Microbulbifer agarilyticus]